MKIVKKWDIIIIVFLILISFIPYVIFMYSQSANSSEVYAVISVNGKEHKKIRLDNHKSTEQFTINQNKEINTIQIVEDKIAIIEANCPDHICEKPGFISKVGDRLVCLPHKVVIEIKGIKNNDSDEDFISR